jgi:hypothetical protein
MLQDDAPTVQCTVERATRQTCGLQPFKAYDSMLIYHSLANGYSKGRLSASTAGFVQHHLANAGKRRIKPTTQRHLYEALAVPAAKLESLTCTT